jgi:predicted hydrolase (HD superfamily)
MPLTRGDAWTKLCEWTESASLRRHARAVEVVMRGAASRYGAGSEEEEAFGIAGLLHDADYELWPDDHPKRIVAWLGERREAALAFAISAHYTRWGVTPVTALDKCLIACDELTGFVVACALVRPDGVNTLEVTAVLKKLKQKGFAAKVDRSEIDAGVGLLGVPLDDHVAFVIETLRPFAEELGIAGSAPHD